MAALRSRSMRCVSGSRSSTPSRSRFARLSTGFGSALGRGADRAGGRGPQAPGPAGDLSRDPRRAPQPDTVGQAARRPLAGGPGPGERSLKETLRLDRSPLDPDTIPAPAQQASRQSHVRRLADRAQRRIRLLSLAGLPATEAASLSEQVAKATSQGDEPAAWWTMEWGLHAAWDERSSESPGTGRPGQSKCAQSPRRADLVPGLQRLDAERLVLHHLASRESSVVGLAGRSLRIRGGGPGGLALLPDRRTRAPGDVGNDRSSTHDLPLGGPPARSPPSRPRRSQRPSHSRSASPRSPRRTLRRPSTSCLPIPPGSASTRPRRCSAAPDRPAAIRTALADPTS